MSGFVSIDFRGIAEADTFFAAFADNVKRSRRLAVNAAARVAARLASKRVREQVALPRGYIGEGSSPGAKIRITRFAQGSDAEAVVATRDRPTSLARFAMGKPTFGKGPRAGVQLQVKTQGGRAVIRRGFYIRLRKGAILTEDAFNVGLAVRLKEGERMAATQKASPLGGGVYLLYGPSVGQVFDTVRDDIRESVLDHLQFEFNRQFTRLSRG